MRTQYRVAWKRAENNPKSRKCASLKDAERFLGLLTSDEPWRFLRKPFEANWEGPDSYLCCDGGGWEGPCVCGGVTLREFCDSKRAGLPPIEWARVESRQVTPFAAVTLPPSSELCCDRCGHQPWAAVAAAGDLCYLKAECGGTYRARVKTPT